MPDKEKRRSHRFKLDTACLVKPVQAHRAAIESVFPAETNNISRDGLCFVTATPWEIGTRIECVIHLPVEPFPQKTVEIQCRGRVVRVVPKKEGGYEVGATIEHYSYLHPAENLEQLAASYDLKASPQETCTRSSASSSQQTGN